MNKGLCVCERETDRQTNRRYHEHALGDKTERKDSTRALPKLDQKNLIRKILSLPKLLIFTVADKLLA